MLYKLIIISLLLTNLLLFAACSKEKTVPTAQVKLSTGHIVTVADIKTGQKIYNKNCAYCHTTGTLKATKFGSKDAWAEQISEGMEHLVNNAIFGIGKMPPRGGNHNLSDDEIVLAVEYIVVQSQ